MACRVFTAVSVLSLVGLLLTAALWLVSYDLDPQYNIIRIGPIRITAWSGTVSISNQAVPYTGSIVSIAWSIRQPPLPKVGGLDLPGLYFRCLTWPNRTDWTLTASVLYPIVLTAVLPMIWILLPRKKSRALLYCRHCRYNLTGNTSGVCPECGTPTTVEAKA